MQTSIVSDEHHQHIYGTGKNGPTAGSRHMMHHPPSHSNSNYNISSYGYDNYAIDDDMMMLDEDDLEDVDRLYDMDAVWADHDHDKLKVPSNNMAKKVRGLFANVFLCLPRSRPVSGRLSDGGWGGGGVHIYRTGQTGERRIVTR